MVFLLMRAADYRCGLIIDLMNSMRAIAPSNQIHH
jgi:hypothetical protein